MTSSSCVQTIHNYYLIRVFTQSSQSFILFTIRVFSSKMFFLSILSTRSTDDQNELIWPQVNTKQSKVFGILPRWHTGSQRVKSPSSNFFLCQNVATIRKNPFVQNTQKTFLFVITMQKFCKQNVLVAMVGL